METPRLIVDLDVFEANLVLAEKLFAGTGKHLRPHVKAHRTPALAVRQLGGCARGVTCATVGEAEAMEAAGIDDVLIANEVVDPSKLARLAGLARRASVTLAVDSLDGLVAASVAAVAAATEIGIVVDLDLGIGRCGVADTASAVELAAAATRADGLRFRGLMGYEGRRRAGEADRADVIRRAYARLLETKAAVERARIRVDVVSSAGTSTLLDALAAPGITEVQAGTYAFMEADLNGLGLPFARAAWVSATVISRSDGRLVVDAGRKSIGCDNGPPDCRTPGLSVIRTFEEHTSLACGDDPPPLGSTVGLWPSHIPATFNLHDTVLAMRAGGVAEELGVVARGRSS